MANAVFKLDNYQLEIYDDITSNGVITPILQDIENYIQNYDFGSNEFKSFAMKKAPVSPGTIASNSGI